MGEHRTNPRAIAAARGEFRIPPGSEVFGFGFETVLELNKEKMAEVTAIVDAAAARGDDPRKAVPPLDPKEHPEWFDYVVYNRPSVGRPSVLMNQTPTAQLRFSEHLRIPLVELRSRADQAFAGAESRGAEH